MEKKEFKTGMLKYLRKLKQKGIFVGLDGHSNGRYSLQEALREQEMNRIKLFDMILKRIKSNYGLFKDCPFEINGWIIEGEKDNGYTILSKGKVILEMCLN